MPSCCITSCKTRHYTSRKLKFYRIPGDYRPFQANRRRLWLRAIQQANGSTEPLRENARICGAHFMSGEASMDHDSPDFVPSVFTSTPQSPKKKGKWVYGRRKRRRRAAYTEEIEEEEEEEETQIPSSPSEPKDGNALIKEAETETKAVKEQRTLKMPTGIPKLDNMKPVVLLKSVFAPGDGYRCELCNQHFPIASQLVKHKQLHEEEEEERSFSCTICGKLFTSEADFTEHQRVHEPSFPCNMCDRSFTTSQYLKRHKLLHVRDGRKCKKCGVLFCQRHNQVLFQPQIQTREVSCSESVAKPQHLESSLLPVNRHRHNLFQPQTQNCEESRSASEKVSSITEPQHLGGSLLPVNVLLVNPETNQTADLCDDAQSTITVTPLQESAVPTASCAPPNLKPLPETYKVENNQLVKPVPNQTADLHEDAQSTITVTPSQETTAQHVQEPLFSCNMCDRSFTRSYGLERHKLMHFTESKRCNKCGRLFCQCHRHNLLQPQTQNCEESRSASEQVSSITEPQHLGGSLLPVNVLLVNPETNQTADLCDDAQSTITVTPLQESAAPTASCAPPNLKPLPETYKVENNQLVKPVPNQTADLHEDAQSTITVTPLQESAALTASCAPPNLTPLPKTPKVDPPGSHTEISSEIPLPVLIQSFTVPRPQRPPRPSSLIRLQHPKLPPSLKLFSPEYLTSSFIKVKRNYDYILSNARGVNIKKDFVQENFVQENFVQEDFVQENCVVKEEPCEVPLSPPKELKIVNVRHIKKESVKCVKKEKIAYDLDFVL